LTNLIEVVTKAGLTVSNLVHTKRFWNQTHSLSKHWKV
jgi:hypothetical protein